MTPSEISVLTDVRAKLSLTAELLTEAMSRVTVKEVGSHNARAVIDAHAAVLRAEGALSTLVNGVEIDPEVGHEANHEEGHADGRGGGELPRSGSADERGRLPAGRGPDGQRHEESALNPAHRVVPFRNKEDALMNDQGETPKGRRSTRTERVERTETVEGSGEFDSVTENVSENAAIRSAGDEGVDPAAGGPQPQDVSVDYATRNVAQERASQDSGDNRSNPKGDPDLPPPPIEE